jgi:2-dehydropantoate 2-reductase
MWSKLLCNVGCNQATMVFQCGYGGLQVPGKPRDTMLGAMREVMAVANAQGIPLTDADMQSWVDIIDVFPPDGETSMQQDGKAHRKSEVELFSGTIRRLGRSLHIATPVNDWLYQRIQEIEAAY